jgi:SNF2 family DNA or RNA helicase
MPELATIPWLHIIADECQRMKNRKTQMTQALKAIKDVSWKTAMSGTPVVNRPDELWSVLNWLYPRDYRSYWRFFNAHVEYQQSQIRGRVIRQVIGPKDTDTLQEAIAPWYVRRLKKDVLKDLPPKYWTERKVDLTPTQRTAYNMMRDNMIAWIGQQQEDVLPAPVVIAQLTRLQQFSAAYAEYSESGAVRLAEPSSKLDAVMEILDEAGELQVVVFSRFKGTLALLEKRLAADNITYDTLTGDTPQETRAAAVQRFQRGHARVFLGTIQAGGVGITLTAASTVIFIDRDWSPALNEQAEDRLHRIGQKDAVQVIDIIARNTVDLGKLQKVEVKKQWIRQMLGDK